MRRVQPQVKIVVHQLGERLGSEMGLRVTLQPGMEFTA